LSGRFAAGFFETLATVSLLALPGPKAGRFAVLGCPANRSIVRRRAEKNIAHPLVEFKRMAGAKGRSGAKSTHPPPKFCHMEQGGVRTALTTISH
jgi:hypothetical protein